MELKVWVEGIQRVVCGISGSTTCQDVIYTLAQATGKTGRYVLIEKWRTTERSLSPADKPLHILAKWGEYANDIQFVLARLPPANTTVSCQQQRSTTASNHKTSIATTNPVTNDSAVPAYSSNRAEIINAPTQPTSSGYEVRNVLPVISNHPVQLPVNQNTTAPLERYNEPTRSVEPSRAFRGLVSPTSSRRLNGHGTKITSPHNDDSSLIQSGHTTAAGEIIGSAEYPNTNQQHGRLRKPFFIDTALPIPESGTLQLKPQPKHETDTVIQQTNMSGELRGQISIGPAVPFTELVAPFGGLNQSRSTNLGRERGGNRNAGSRRHDSNPEMSAVAAALAAGAVDHRPMGFQPIGAKNINMLPSVESSVAKLQVSEYSRRCNDNIVPKFQEKQNNNQPSARRSAMSSANCSPMLARKDINPSIAGVTRTPVTSSMTYAPPMTSLVQQQAFARQQAHKQRQQGHQQHEQPQNYMAMSPSGTSAVPRQSSSRRVRPPPPPYAVAVRYSGVAGNSRCTSPSASVYSKTGPTSIYGLQYQHAMNPLAGVRQAGLTKSRGTLSSSSSSSLSMLPQGSYGPPPMPLGEARCYQPQPSLVSRTGINVLPTFIEQPVKSNSIDNISPPNNSNDNVFHHNVIHQHAKQRSTGPTNSSPSPHGSHYPAPSYQVPRDQYGRMISHDTNAEKRSVAQETSWPFQAQSPPQNQSQHKYNAMQHQIREQRVQIPHAPTAAQTDVRFRQQMGKETIPSMSEIRAAHGASLSATSSVGPNLKHGNLAPQHLYHGSNSAIHKLTAQVQPQRRRTADAPITFIQDTMAQSDQLSASVAPTTHAATKTAGPSSGHTEEQEYSQEELALIVDQQAVLIQQQDTKMQALDQEMLTWEAQESSLTQKVVSMNEEIALLESKQHHIRRETHEFSASRESLERRLKEMDDADKNQTDSVEHWKGKLDQITWELDAKTEELNTLLEQSRKESEALSVAETVAEDELSALRREMGRIDAEGADIERSLVHVNEELQNVEAVMREKRARLELLALELARQDTSFDAKGFLEAARGEMMSMVGSDDGQSSMSQENSANGSSDDEIESYVEDNDADAHQLRKRTLRATKQRDLDEQKLRRRQQQPAAVSQANNQSGRIISSGDKIKKVWV